MIGWGGGLSHERKKVAEAETLGTDEGNMCGIAMRDAIAPPGSKVPEPSKPIDKTSRGGVTSHRAVTTVNALWPRK